MKEVKEANIIINGHQLDNAQSMAIRVAIGSLISDNQPERKALGDDGLGVGLSSAYCRLGTEILDLIFLAFK